MFLLRFEKENNIMAIKSVVQSDLSGKDIPEGNAVTMIIHEHPALDGRPVELDLDQAEADKFQTKQLDLVNVTVNGRRVVMDTASFNALFKGKDVAEVIQSARRADSGQQRRGRGPGRKQASGGERVDYTSPENAGMLHRGRITEAEIAWVKANREQASKNREKQSGKPIDFTDPAEKKRYQL